jgi:hypothetical protein
MAWGLMGCAAIAQAQTTLTSLMVEGQCIKGAPYKLHTNRENHATQQVSGYAYEGPVGQGALLSSALWTKPVAECEKKREVDVGCWTMLMINGPYCRLNRLT